MENKQTVEINKDLFDQLVENTKRLVEQNSWRGSGDRYLSRLEEVLRESSNVVIKDTLEFLGLEELLEYETGSGCLFFYVYNPLGNKPHFKHETEDAARKEAERLARQNPGVHFYVLGNYGSCVVNDIVWSN